MKDLIYCKFNCFCQRIGFKLMFFLLMPWTMLQSYPQIKTAQSDFIWSILIQRWQCQCWCGFDGGWCVIALIFVNGDRNFARRTRSKSNAMHEKQRNITACLRSYWCNYTISDKSLKWKILWSNRCSLMLLSLLLL